MKRLALAAAAALAALPAGAAGLDRNPELAGWMEHALERSMAGSFARTPAAEADRYMTEDGARNFGEAVERSGNGEFIRRGHAVWTTDVSALRVVSEDESDGVHSIKVAGEARSVYDLGTREVVQPLEIYATFVQPASAEGRDGMLIKTIVGVSR